MAELRFVRGGSARDDDRAPWLRRLGWLASGASDLDAHRNLAWKPLETRFRGLPGQHGSVSARFESSAREDSRPQLAVGRHRSFGVRGPRASDAVGGISEVASEPPA